MSLPKDAALTRIYETNESLANDAAVFKALQDEQSKKIYTQQGFVAGQEQGMLEAVNRILAQAHQYSIEDQVRLRLISPEAALEHRQYEEGLLPTNLEGLAGSSTIQPESMYEDRKVNEPKPVQTK